MSRSELQALAEKYFDGTASSEEKALLSQWYNTIHDNDGDETVAIEVLDAEDELKQRIFDNISSKINFETENVPVETKSRRIIGRMVLRIAAAAIVFIVAGALWYYNQPQQQLRAASINMVNITTAKITRIILPDGSLVWLNAHTTLRYPSAFTGKLRQVELAEGRAFFDIKHEVAHPFIVKTKHLNITVLGTSFDVRSYRREGTTKVSVITGKVGITLPGHYNEPAVMLLPKQQAVLSKTTSQLTKELTHEPVVNLWCKSPLVFEQENLDNVFKAIEKQYNTRIEVSNKKLLDERISITLSNQRLDTIMEILSFTKHFNYQIANDSTVMIK